MKFVTDNKIILVLSQRDIKHPKSGGAETYVHYAMQRLARNYTIVHISVFHPQQKSNYEVIDNIHYLRESDNLVKVIFCGYKFYKENKENIILIIDHCNTHQYFTYLWAKNKRVMLIHHIGQDVCTYVYGKYKGGALKKIEEYILKKSTGDCITISQSTKDELIKRGFVDVYLCYGGTECKYKEIPDRDKKEDYLVYIGRVVTYKRVEDAIILAKHVGKRLYIIGDGWDFYINQLKELVKSLEVDCIFMGYLPKEDKDVIIEKAYMNIMPSMHEGWGLVITENAILGTPSLVYPVNGVRDAVEYGRAGFMAKEVSVEALIEEFEAIEEEKYEEIRNAAFDVSTTFTWDRTSIEFEKIILSLINKPNNICKKSLFKTKRSDE